MADLAGVVNVECDGDAAQGGPGSSAVFGAAVQALLQARNRVGAG